MNITWFKMKNRSILLIITCSVGLSLRSTRIFDGKKKLGTYEHGNRIQGMRISSSIITTYIRRIPVKKPIFSFFSIKRLRGIDI